MMGDNILHLISNDKDQLYNKSLLETTLISSYTSHMKYLLFRL